jgi:hypothetical protein
VRKARRFAERKEKITIMLMGESWAMITSIPSRRRISRFSTKLKKCQN